jgi:hypothetical protein
LSIPATAKTPAPANPLHAPSVPGRMPAARDLPANLAVRETLMAVSRLPHQVGGGVIARSAMTQGAFASLSLRSTWPCLSSPLPPGRQERGESSNTRPAPAASARNGCAEPPGTNVRTPRKIPRQRPLSCQIPPIVPPRNRFPNIVLTFAPKLIFRVKARLKPPRVGFLSCPAEAG